jgi:uncharacterized protein YggU (UPF0235/DUF167 family)
LQTQTGDFWRVQADGVVVAIRAQPRAKRAGLQGAFRDAGGRLWLRIAVTAAPEDGRATNAVRATLAEALGVPASRVSVLSGAGTREKLLHVAGPPEALVAAMRGINAKCNEDY